MSYLLDTHTLLWYTQHAPELSKRASDLISKPDETILVSIASLWEIAIKVNIGKLRISGDIARLAQEIHALQFELVGIDVPTLDTHRTLPIHHRDPFDRLLIAYAMTHSHDIISSDAQFDAYSIRRIW